MSINILFPLYQFSLFLSHPPVYKAFYFFLHLKLLSYYHFPFLNIKLMTAIIIVLLVNHGTQTGIYLRIIDIIDMFCQKIMLLNK